MLLRCPARMLPMIFIYILLDEKKNCNILLWLTEVFFTNMNELVYFSWKIYITHLVQNVYYIHRWRQVDCTSQYPNIH